MKYQAILFDLDGTLLNTIADIGTAANAALERLGYPVHSPQDYTRMVGHGLRSLVEKALPENSTKQDVDEAVRTLLEEYEHCYAEKTRPYPGIEKMLDELQALGVRMAILSNKNHEFTVKIVDSLLSRWNFEHVYGSRDSVPKKPDPQMALEIARMMDLSPEQFLFVGDSGTDIKTALSANMSPVGVSWGYRSIEDIRQAGASVVIVDPARLVQIVRQN